MVALSGFACAGEQGGDAQGDKGHRAGKRGNGSYHDSAVRVSSSDGATGDAGRYKDSCRIQTHIVKKDMSKAEIKDFTARVIYLVQANLNGGGDKNLGERLDDIDVPAYRGPCGQL